MDFIVAESKVKNVAITTFVQKSLLWVSCIISSLADNNNLLLSIYALFSCFSNAPPRKK